MFDSFFFFEIETALTGFCTKPKVGNNLKVNLVFFFFLIIEKFGRASSGICACCTRYKCVMLLSEGGGTCFFLACKKSR